VNHFKVLFNEEELGILERNKVIIRGNHRYYLFSEKDTVPLYGVPHYYQINDFAYKGTSWIRLLLEFGNWFVLQQNNLEFCLDLKYQNQKKIFSKSQETNFTGPLLNGLYINNTLGVKSWGLIIDLLNFLNITNKGYIIIHFPFQRENPEISRLLWIKESNLFYHYLIAVGYNQQDSIGHIKTLEKLCLIYKMQKRTNHKLLGYVDINNPYIISADSKTDFSNAISQLKKSKDYSDKYHPTILNLIDFKSEVYYEDLNFKNISVNF